MREVRNLVKRIAIIFLSITIVFTSTSFEQLTAVAAGTAPVVEGEQTEGGSEQTEQTEQYNDEAGNVDETPNKDETPNEDKKTAEGGNAISMLMSSAPLNTVPIEEVKKTYTLTINYGSEDGNVIIPPYISEYIEGEHYEVTSPIYNGYTPDVSKVEGILEGDQTDIVITVNYTANLVSYTVLHSFEQLDGNYIVDNTRTQNVEGTVGQLTNAQALTTGIDGFTAKEVNQILVNADGTTTITLEYSRNSNYVYFNVNGGSYIEPVNKKYEENFDLANSIPTKAGYVFDGWYTDNTYGTKVGTVTMGISDIQIYAKWSASIVDYKVIYMTQNLDNENEYSVKESETKTAVPGTMVSIAKVSAKNIPGFTYKESTNVTVAGDGSTVIYVKYDRNTYSLTFKEYKKNSWKTFKTITAKYEADISAQWPIGYQCYRFEDNQMSQYFETSCFTMPGKNITYRCKSTNDGYTYVSHYYIENVDPNSTTGRFFSSKYYTEHSNSSISMGGNPSIVDVSEFQGQGSGIPGFEVLDKFQNYEYNRFDGTYHAYIYFNRNSYTIKFNANGGTGIPAPISEKYEASVTKPVKEPIRTGYKFMGWYTNEAGTGAVYTFTTMPARNIELFAKWTPEQYKVTFDYNYEGSPTDSFETVNYLNTVTRPADPVREGYVFKGWYTNEAGSGSSYVFAKPVSSNVTIFAKWEAMTVASYTVYYIKKGGSISDSNDYIIPLKIVTGLKVGSYVTEKAIVNDTTGIPDQVTQGITLTTGVNTIVFEYQTSGKVSYTIKFIQKGGVDDGKVLRQPLIQETSKGQVVVTYTHISGYTPDALQKKLVLSASEPEKNEIIFYYTKNIVINAYEINYYFENESGKYTVDDTKKISGSGNAGNQILANTPFYKGFTINSKMSSINGTISGTENTKLNLNVFYSKNKYTITYDPNNNVTSNKTISQEVFHNGQTSVIENSYTAQKHYHFYGWNTKKDGSGTAYKANDTILNIVDNLMLYAIWEEDTKYEVTYNVNGGTGSVNDNQKYYQGDEVTVKDITGVKAPEGKKFSGWTMDGIALFKDDKFIIQKDTELVANWIDKTKYTITYHGNGGTLIGTQNTQYSFYEDVNASIAPNMFNYPGYEFKRWCIDADGKGTTYTQSQNVNPFTGNLDLYAIWTRDNEKWVEVAYNTNGGSGTLTPDYNKEYLKDSNITILDKTDDMSRNQAIFLGWTVNKTNLITQKADLPKDADLYVKDDVYAKIKGNLSLYAVWAIDTDKDGTPDYEQFSLKYDVNGGMPELFDMNFYQVNETAILKNAISKTSRVFLGWTVEDLVDVTKADQLNSITIFKDNYTMIQDTTLHAVWAIDADKDGTPDYAEYRVVYDKNATDATGDMLDNHLYSGKAGDNSVSLQGNGFVRSGYAFVGWSTNKDDKVNLIQAGAIIPVVDKSITLYAQWKKLYTIEFKAGMHGQITTDNINFSVIEGTSWSDSGVTPPNVQADFGYKLMQQNWDIAFPTLIEANYVFTAQYEKDEEDWAAVGYELNGGSGTAPVDSNSPYLKGRDATILNKTDDMVREQAVFLGWSTDSKELISEKKDVPDEASLFVEGETYTNIQNVLTLYAVWAIDKDNDGTPDYDEFRVTYNKNAEDATGITTDNKFYSGKQVEVSATIKENGFTREGYVFAGWRSTTDKSGELLLPNATMKVSANVALYAQWIKLMDVSATPYEGLYTGKAKGIELTGVPQGAMIYYSLSEDVNAENYLTKGTQTLDLESIDEVVDAGNYNVYYYIIADNHVPFKGSELVKINKVELKVLPTTTPKTIQYGDDLPVFDIQISGFVNDENRDKVSGINQLKYESTYIKGNGIGDYTVSITEDSFEKLTATNYTFVKGTEEVKFVVAPKTITVNIDGKVLKVYDGTNDAPDLSGRFSSDDVSDGSEIRYQSAEFNSPDVNTAKYVTVFGLTAGENYNIVLEEGQDGLVFDAEITARPITITAGSASRTFNNQQLTQKSSTITSGNLVENHFYKAITSGSITNPGSISNTITEYRIYSLNDGESIEIDEINNYKVSLVPGTLTINAAPATDGGQETTPTTPATTPTTTITPGITATAATLAPAVVTFEEAPVALAARPRTVTPVEATVEEETSAMEADDVVIADEDTALADEVTEIAEEETPLAVPVDNCPIHWLILILTAAYAIFEIVRGFARKKKIDELTEGESINKSDAKA